MLKERRRPKTIHRPSREDGQDTLQNCKRIHCVETQEAAKHTEACAPHDPQGRPGSRRADLLPDSGIQTERRAAAVFRGLEAALFSLSSERWSCYGIQG